jgi:hypothetical protein
LLSVLALVTACGQGPPIKGPEFDVKVAMSEAALSTIEGLGERIKVAAFFDGDSIFGSPFNNAPFRSVFLGHQVVEISPTEIAHFQNVTFPSREFSHLLFRKYFVTINVFSARRKDPKNLLNCSTPEKSSGQLANQVIVVKCTLRKA